jgi:hypothetical protein
VTASDHLLLPEGTRLVHIGPHKTGTTTLQGAFHLARRAASKQGVHYAGPNRQPAHAAQAIAALPDGAAQRRIGSWLHLVDEVRKAREPRVVVSSEWFADARVEGIRRVVSDLDPARVHVVVTLRSLGRMLASQWQQLAQGGWSLPYERWLETIFNDPAGTEGIRFWHRHAHDRLIERWVEVVGRHQVIVVVADDRDRGAVLRAFEQLTGLETGTLVAPDDRSNRSLTAAEVELVRQIHLAIKDLGVDSASRLNLVLFDVAGTLKLRTPDRAEARIETPQWTLDESARLERQVIAAIRAMGLAVIGDLDSLLTKDSAPVITPPPPSDAAFVELAAAASMGLLGGIGLARRSFRRGSVDGWPDPGSRVAAGLTGGLAPDTHEALSTERLVGVLKSRVRGSLSARFGERRRPRSEASVHSPPAEVE